MSEHTLPSRRSLPESFTVRPTWRDWWNGQPGQPYSCPLALAVHREIGHWLHVDEEYASIFVDAGDGAARVEWRHDGVEFVRGFDRRRLLALPRTVRFTRVN